MERTQERLLSIAARGITLAIDDFGAGYSSFRHLASLPVHHLKLDRTLMASMPRNRKGFAIARAIQILSNTLSLTLTMEGIEHYDQQLFCQQAGIEQGQGFLLGMPMSLTEIETKFDVLNVAAAIAA